MLPNTDYDFNSILDRLQEVIAHSVLCAQPGHDLPVGGHALDTPVLGGGEPRRHAGEPHRPGDLLIGEGGDILTRLQDLPQGAADG